MSMLNESPRITATHARILVLAFLGWMFDFYDLILYTFLTRPISADLGIDRMDHSVALGLSFAATAVGGIGSGWLADRYGRRRLVSWTILLYSAGSLLSGLSTSRAMLFGARVITGLGVGGEWAAGHALVAETFPARSRGRAGALLQTAAPVGVGLAALVGTWVAPRVGWRACLIGSSATALIAFVARRWMPESDVWRRGQAAKFDLGKLVASPRFLFAFVLTSVNGASYWLTYSWMPEYLRSRGLSLGASGRQMAVIVAGEICGYATFGFISDRIGRRPAFTLFALTMATGLVPLTIGWGRFPWSVIWAATWLTGFGTGTWSNFGPMLAELFPTEARTTAMGTILNLSRAVQLVAPIAIAALEPRFGLASGVGMAAVFAVCASALVWLLPETRGREIHV
jgi:MFS family permease